MNTDFISSPGFDMPHYLAPSAWVEHIPFAFELTSKLKPRLIVELGVFNGVSYFAFCQAVRSTKLNTVCYGIDNWHGDDHTSFYNEDVFQKVNSYNKATYADFSHLLRSDFSDSLQNFRDNSIDLLHIDGLHTYEAVKNDFETWLPKLSDSSIVLFHDTVVRDRGFGVFRLWEELSSVYPSFLFTHGYGLGVLATGKNIPKELLPLFQYGDKEISQIRTLYHRLGLPFSEMLKVEELNVRAGESTGELEALQARILQLQQEVEDLGAWGRRSNEELEAANSRIRQLQEEIEQLGAWGRHSNEELEAANNQTRLLQEEKNVLQEEANVLQEEANALHKEANVLNDRISALSEELRKVSELNESQRQDYELEKTKNLLDRAQKNNYNTRKELERKSNQIYRLESEKKELESRLNEIFSSDGYRLLSLYYKLKGKLIPEGSGRQKKLKNLGRFLKKSTRLIPSKAAIPTSTKVSATRLAQEYNIVPEVPEGIQFPLVFPVQEFPVVSIIIPAYNNWAFTRNCLISIYQFTQDVPYEIIVGDNVSTDETINIEKYFSNITYLRNKENMGYILNINNAASHAKGEFVLTLNNDTTVTPNWLSSMVEIFRKDPRAGLVGSKLVYPDGSLQEAGGIIWKDASAWNYGKGADPQAPEFNYVKEVDYISGASNLIRRDLWLQLKGLDERYVPAYFDDSDLAMSIRRLGYKVIYQPLSVVVHYEGLTHGTSTGSGTKRYQQLNHEKFVDKWKTVLSEEHLENGKNVFYARDKSARKKTIVVIDHYVPMFDKDAGSRTVFQYLDLFVDMGLNVKFIGDNFYRHEPYTTILQQKGIEVLYGSYYAENWIKWLTDNDQYIDYIFLNRPHISIKYIDLIKKRMHGKIFYYMHDLHFVREQKEYEITKDETKLASALQWKETEYSLFNQSDVVLTPSTKEKEILYEDFPGKPIQVMPAFFYPSIADPIRDFQNRKDILFIGGFNHAPNVDAALWFANDVFPLIRKKNKEMRLIIVGSLAPDKITRLASAGIVVRGFVSDEELENIYKEVRLSVIPLRYGAGVKGKTAEALSRGIPIVSTSFGIEGLKDVDLFLKPYDDAESLANAVTTLYSDIPSLEALSESAVIYARENLTKSSASVFFKTLFNL